MTDVKCFRCGNDNNYYVMDDGEHYCMKCLSICDQCDKRVFNEDIIRHEGFYRCTDCEPPSCEYHSECGNLAEYILTRIDGKTIYVCENCDGGFSLCEECGLAGRREHEMSFWHSADEWPTCFHCQAKLQKEAEDELRSEIEKHIKAAMPDCHWDIPQEFKDAMFEDIKGTEAFEDRRFYSDSCISLAFQHVVLYAIKKANPDYGDEGSEANGR